MTAPAVVRIFYPADPVGVVPGGVDTFIRGILKWAPDDLVFELVGMTTDPVARPLGRWTRCELGRRHFDFYPVVRVADAGQRSRLPLSVRYTTALLANWRQVHRGFDVMEFHRIEPALPFLRDQRPKNAFFHQDMGVIRSEAKADILWRKLPWFYFALESHVISRLDSAWCVREEGVRALRARNPAKAAALNFVPTWVDTEVFSPLGEAARAQARAELAATTGLDTNAVWVVSVGRLDTQKDPSLLLEALARLSAKGKHLCWLAVGDGVLRPTLVRQIQEAGLDAKVSLLGLRSPAEIARIMGACDVYALSSAYEGMPMSLLEALGCGLPVCSTDVGEVRLVVTPGMNGELATTRTSEAFAQALQKTVTYRDAYCGAPAIASVAGYLPHLVLQPVYENYRRLAERNRMVTA